MLTNSGAGSDLETEPDDLFDARFVTNYAEGDMPLPTSATLTPLDPARHVRELIFIEAPVVSTQARFDHRRILIPDIDLSAYRFKAVIDFIVVRVFTRRTQHQWIQDDLRTVLPCDSWILPINPGAGNVAEEFDIKIQEPRSTTVVVAAIEAVSRNRGERRAPHIREIEFSLDVYSRAGDDEPREKMVGLLQRTYFAETVRWQNDRDMPRTTAMHLGESGPAPQTRHLTPGRGENETHRGPCAPSRMSSQAHFWKAPCIWVRKTQAA